MKKLINFILFSLLILATQQAPASESRKAIAKDYQNNLAPLWDYFHRNPELSLMETKTAARLAKEIRALGYKVTEISVYSSIALH